MSRRRKAASFIASVMCVPLIIAGCSTLDSAGDVAESESNSNVAEFDSDATLRIGMGSLVASLDPNSKTTGPPATNVFYPAFDALTTISVDGEVEAALAMSWDRIDDRTWRINLRPDVEFSNGETFDASDVKFTFDHVLDPANEQIVRSRIDTIESVEIVDALTVHIISTAPDPILLKRLASVFILPDEYYSEVGPDGFASEPIGTGPFAYSQFTPSTSVTLEAVATSWRGQPKFRQIEMTAMPDASARVAALQSGGIDIAEALPPGQASEMESSSTVSVKTAILGQANVIVLDTVGFEPLKDLRVRQALNYAVDKDALANIVMSGFASPAGQLVSDNGFGHAPDVKPYEYDPAKAKALLEEAGYANGFDMTIYTTQGLQLQDKQLTEATAGYLAEIGVRVTTELIDTSGYVAEYHAGGMTPGFFIGWWYAPAMDGDFVYVWSESSRPQSRWHNVEFDELFAQSRITMDSAKRLEVMREMAKLFHDEAPVIFMVHPAEIYGVSNLVSGFEPRADRVMWIDDVSVSQK